MARTKRLHEFLLLLVNRGVIPASVFAALAFFERSLTHAAFESFLLAFSLNQWILNFGFQWQKNAAVRLYDYKNYRRISVTVLILMMIISAGFYVLFAHFSGMALLIGGLVYTLAAGVLYFVSTNYRMRGSVKLYANIDTVFQVLRWAVAVLAVLIIPAADSPFWGAAAAVIVAIAIFGFMARDRATYNGPRLTWMGYLSVGIWLALFDFAGSGMMYIDRFFVLDKNYILNSTVSSQIGSVLFGALIAATYPRVMISAREGGGAWRREYKRMARFVIPLLVLTPVLCVTAGPILLGILSPGAPVDLSVLLILGLCQSLHHVIYLVSIILILYSKNYICAGVYVCFFFIYSGTLALMTTREWLLVAALKLLFLVLTLGVISASAYFVSKESQDVAANQKI